ncbi:MAG: hypothetical protein QM692_21090 [Thermomicrobiales bacterium]
MDPLPPIAGFRSFWQAGFESASHINGRGVRVDMIAATQHVEQAAGDYARIRRAGFQVAREGVRWPLVERRGGYDFSSVTPIIAAAAAHDVQVLWTLCHYGWPHDLDLFSPAFVERFARYCAAFARFLRASSDEIPYVVPINEISFLAFAAGQVGWFHPFARERGGEAKAQLVRAAIAGIEAIRAVEPRARIIHVDPVINVVSANTLPATVALARRQTESQFEAWDWLAGRARPELGGHPRYLDIVGANFYHDNQWDTASARLDWAASPRDPRWLPLHQMLERVSRRYGRPLFLAETSHVGVGRGAWLREVAQETQVAQARGVAIAGITLYPILDRPDWHDPEHWHHSGLWDLVPDAQGQLQRVPVSEYMEALQSAQAALPAVPRPG